MQDYEPRQWSSEVAQRTSPPPRGWSSEMAQRISPPPPNLMGTAPKYSNETTATIPTEPDDRSSSPPPNLMGTASKYANGTAATIPTDPGNRSSRNLGRSSSAKIAAMAERRVARGLEMQQQLALLQEELKKVKIQLAVAEEEKSKISNELGDMKSLAEDRNLKLSEALVAQRQAQEGWELEKVRVKELEQASVESAQKRDQAWLLELESFQLQHNLDSETLLSATHELNQVNQELSVAVKEKNEALREAMAAKNIAKANSNRVKELSAELDSLKEQLNLANADGLANQTSSVMEPIIHECENAKDVMVDLAECVPCVGKQLELNNEKEPESQEDLIPASQTRIKILDLELTKARESETKTFESLISQTKQLEEAKISLEEAKLEIASLQENIRSLEASIGQSNRDLSISHQCLAMAKLDTHSVKETMEALKTELGHAQERERLALLNAHSLTEKMELLATEMKLATEAEEKSKRAMDGLALALKEVTTEANQAKEELAATKIDLENARMDADRWKLRLMRAEEKFQGLLDAAKVEAEEAAETARKENSKLRDSLKQAMNEASAAKEAAEIARRENSQLKNSLSEMGSTFQKVNLENESLKANKMEAPENVKETMGLPPTATSPIKLRALEKTTSMIKEPRDRKKLVKHRSGPLPKLLDFELENPKSRSGSKDEGEDSDATKVEKTITMIPESKESKKSVKHLSGPLKKQQILNAESENPKLGYGPKDEGDDSDALHVSILDMAPDNGNLHASIPSMSYQKAPSSLITDDAESVNLDVFDDIDGNHFDETESDRNLEARHKKKAFIRRFGGMLRRKHGKKHELQQL